MERRRHSPGAAAAARSLQVFTGSGGIVEEASESPATRTAGYGTWERVEGRLYAASVNFFRFNLQTGEVVGSQRIDRAIRLADDGKSFTAVARVTVFDASGNVVASNIRVTATGKRLDITRIADQP